MHRRYACETSYSFIDFIITIAQIPYQEPLLLIWINFNTNVDKNSMLSKVWDESTYPFQTWTAAPLKSGF